MATIKVSNEEVILKAKNKIAVIQCDRNKAELEAIEDIQKEFESINMRWVFERQFTDWFKYFGPFAIIGLVFYPFSVLCRLYSVKTKPESANIYEIAIYLDKLLQSGFFYRVDTLSSGMFDRQLNSCLSLRCMAENNEEDFMTLTVEEAKDLGIC